MEKEQGKKIAKKKVLGSFTKEQKSAKKVCIYKLYYYISTLRPRRSRMSVKKNVNSNVLICSPSTSASVMISILEYLNLEDYEE